MPADADFDRFRRTLDASSPFPIDSGPLVPLTVSISRMFDPITAHWFVKERHRVKAWRVPNQDGVHR